MQANTTSHRLAVVLSHPTQYYSPWFRWIRGHTPLTFRVFYLWDFGVTARRDVQFGSTFQWDVDLLSGYEHEFVSNIARDPGTHHFGGLRNPALTARLAEWRPTAVLTFGYKWASMLNAIFWARRHSVPLLFRGDSHFLGRGKPPGVTLLVLRVLYAQFAAALPVGAANRDYFSTLGMPSDRLHFAPHAVNDTLFDPELPEHRARAGSLRDQLQLNPATKVVLFAGKFVPAKQPVGLLRAFIALNRDDSALVFVGDGEDKPALHALARTARPGTVHFLPFANQSEMPSRYLLADVFALPSAGLYETWGLAVNEAMHMGVPALVSERVGCQRDLVTEGETGWVFSIGAPDGLRAALARALDATAVPADRDQFRTAVRTRIGSYTYAQTTAGLLQALGAIPSAPST